MKHTINRNELEKTKATRVAEGNTIISSTYITKFAIMRVFPKSRPFAGQMISYDYLELWRGHSDPDPKCKWYTGFVSQKHVKSAATFESLEVAESICLMLEHREGYRFEGLRFIPVPIIVEEVVTGFKKSGMFSEQVILGEYEHPLV